MGKRIELQKFLEDILGSREVYFQPPENLKMNYPAIVYNVDDLAKNYADNSTYTRTVGYSVTVIDYDPDSEIFHKISELPMCSFDRSFRSDDLNHYVFTLYF